MRYTLATKLENELVEAADEEQLNKTIARYDRASTRADDMTRVGDGTARLVPDGVPSASRARPDSAVMPGAGVRAE
ncbi:predicted protein [Streptomyces viridosporus ATCC 14672]|uniref:Predicted protein n=1 Tax=Streptomyces viridosporus (strain ATCC 14672 / DSM 40746 / JCM 4963 / KCTC 9882 / NRRL B-12104 / FH 1290) TaxID=566461 RepID=D6A8N5_STRV1|nr:predicted protein [Streptomyces viridosporus ATCC 14672]